MLLDSEKIGEYLSGVEFICQPVPNRHGGEFRQLLDYHLTEAAVFNAVKHARKHPCRVGDALLFAYLRA